MEFRDVCFEIENDDFYRQFFPGLEKTPQEKSMSVTEKIEKLTKGIEKLNAELETQVLSKHHDLLTQASNASNLEAGIASMQTDVQHLLACIEKLRSQVLTPYNSIESQTAALRRILRVTHLIRHSLKIIRLSKNLRSLDANPDIQANLVYDIEQLLSDDNFDGIDFLKEDLRSIRDVKTNLLKNALKRLESGLNDGDNISLLAGFKVLNNLHCGKERIDKIVTSLLKNVCNSIRTALNVHIVTKQDASRSGPGKANVVTSQVYKQQFWDNVERLFSDGLQLDCRKIVLLQETLNNLHSLENFRGVANNFWNELSVTFANELKKSPLPSRQCVEIDFPKLLKCYNDLCCKVNYKEFTVQRETLSPWENSFLSKSLEKLLDPVRTMWQTSQCPSTDSVDAVVRVVSSALSVSLGDKQLSLALATSVAKCIKQMSSEAEIRVCVDGSAGQIVEAPSTAQIRNADLSNILYHFATQIMRVLNNMSNVLHPDSVNMIRESLMEMSNVAILQPFGSSMNSAVDLILASMHSETDLIKQSDDMPTSCSPYLRELQQFITRCKDIYFHLYRDLSAVNKCCGDIASHCIEVFIQNVCTVRPVTAYGRRKLQFDCDYLSIALQPLAEVNTLERHRELRALHTLLGLSPSEILDSQSKGASLSYSLVMMLLFAFGEKNLLSPHQCAGWSRSQLMQWLSKHPGERERLEFAAGALQRYQGHVRQNNLSKYDDVYPILLQLLEDGRKLCQL